MNYETLWKRLTPLYDAGEAKAIVRWMLDECFSMSLPDILCGKVTELSADDQAELQKMMLRLEKGEPIQYVLGRATFCRRTFHVATGVLIPRPETEELCRWITDDTKSLSPAILDIGTGSGCIAITLALEMPKAKVSAWDISDDALRIAKRNAEDLGAQVTFEHRDILDPSLNTHHSTLNTHHTTLNTHHSSLNIIVSNPPYIQPTERDEMAKNVRDYEPALALFAPEDNPIIFYQRIADYAWHHLTTGGALFFELNPLTADAVGDYLRQRGFSGIQLRQDQFGKCRFLKAIRI